MTQLAYSLVDEDADLLGLISEDPRKAADYDTFLAACETVASLAGGIVSVNAVRDRMSNQYGLTVEPRTYSAFWSRACSRTGPMVTLDEYEQSTDKRGHNGNKGLRLRRWVG